MRIKHNNGDYGGKAIHIKRLNVKSGYSKHNLLLIISQILTISIGIY